MRRLVRGIAMKRKGGRKVVRGGRTVRVGWTEKKCILCICSVMS
jgi:hypothetical protein